MQLPLLQSITSQIVGTILGVGDGTGIIGISEMSGVGEGDMKGLEEKKEEERARLELGSCTMDVENGIIRLSELSMTKIKDDVMVSPTLNMDETSLVTVCEGVGIGEKNDDDI